MSEKAKLLKEVAIFGGMSEEIIEFILAHAVESSLKKGEYLFKEGEKSTSMYLIEKGEVAIIKQCGSHQYLLRRLVTGDCIGEMALFDFMPRSASGYIMEDTKLLEISASNLMEIYTQDLEQFAMMTLNMGREVTRRLRVSDERCFNVRVEAEINNGSIEFFTEGQH